MQRTGVGGKLVKNLTERLQQEKVERLYLLMMQDGPAAAFYTKHCFYKSSKMGLYAARLAVEDA